MPAAWGVFPDATTAAPKPAANTSRTSALVDQLIGGGGGGGQHAPSSNEMSLVQAGKGHWGPNNEYVANDAPPAAAAQAAPAGAPGGGSTNTAQSNPDLAYAIGEMKKRYEGDMGTGRAIDVAAGKLRQYSEGQRRQAAAGRTARGVSGTGIDNFDERRVSDDFQRKLAGAATDITQQRESARDATLGTIANVGATQAGISAADRAQALNQWNSVQANARAQDDARLNQTLAIAKLLTAA